MLVISNFNIKGNTQVDVYSMTSFPLLYYFRHFSPSLAYFWHQAGRKVPGTRWEREEAPAPITYAVYVLLNTSHLTRTGIRTTNSAAPIRLVSPSVYYHILHNLYIGSSTSCLAHNDLFW